MGADELCHCRGDQSRPRFSHSPCATPRAKSRTNTMTEPQNTKQELPREVFEAIRRIEDIGGSISAQAYAYRETVTDNLPLLAKDILRLIDDVQKAGKVFRSVAEIAE